VSRIIYVNLSDLEAIEKVAVLMARRSGVITIKHTRAGWNIELLYQKSERRLNESSC